MILRRLINALRVINQALYLLVILAQFVCAVYAVVLGVNGTNDANWTGAMVAICAATLLLLGMRFEPNLDAGAVARGLGVILAVPAAWFWLLSAQEPDTRQSVMAVGVVIMLTVVAIFVVIAAVCAWFSGWLSSRWPGR